MSDKPLPHALNAAFVDELYDAFIQDPSSVREEWRSYFTGLGVSGTEVRPRMQPARWSLFNPPSSANGHAAGTSPLEEARSAILQERGEQLIRHFRERGHLEASLDPLGQPRAEVAELYPEFYGFTREDLDRPFQFETYCPGQRLSLGQIVQKLRSTYCGPLGVEFMHIHDWYVRNWLQERIEGLDESASLESSERVRVLGRLTQAVQFEEFIRKKFVGAKSFSLEGGESVVVALEAAIERAGLHGVEEVVLGMGHRGRLNVLANIVGKPPRHIFREFADRDADKYIGRGDVKYHLGYSGDWTTTDGSEVHLSLCFNPSHLEYVNPVALGRVRAKQDRIGDETRSRVAAVLVHGDAAFAGEGVVQETLNLSQLDAYAVGGALHLIVNNQVGFTTPSWEGRSGPYCSDIAKMLQIPVFHVNGEDPEAVVRAVRLAMDFRQAFQRDVVIDIWCFRRLGHNEGDEPAFTQPLVYELIRAKPTVRDLYLKRLLDDGTVTGDEAAAIVTAEVSRLEEELAQSKSRSYKPVDEDLLGLWKDCVGGPETGVPEVVTAVPADRLRELLEAQTRLPEGFHLNAKLEAVRRNRLEIASGAKPVDWSAAEALAFATLATEGRRIRLSGQDSERGTFSHRHAVLHDTEVRRSYRPLQNLAQGQATVEILNSPLSEAGVLGFEYGYSLDYPEALVGWEAQFGDFWNCAQVIVDQFVVAGEDKWRRLSGITLLLPHGMEGMGPEHSSARLERWLALCAEDNIQVVYPTTAAQFFHCLRRHVLRTWKKPLIIMTPKSLLRSAHSMSGLDELASGGFQRIIPDNGGAAGRSVKRILLCSGKVYFDLEQERQKQKRTDVAIIRVEQLYPLPLALVEEALRPYADGTPVVWVQEEPANMGPWPHMRQRFAERIAGRMPFSGINRAASASPATGSPGAHRKEQEELITRAFA